MKHFWSSLFVPAACAAFLTAGFSASAANQLKIKQIVIEKPDGSPIADGEDWPIISVEDTLSFKVYVGYMDDGERIAFTRTLRQIPELHTGAEMDARRAAGTAFGDHLSDLFQQHGRAVKVDLQDCLDGSLGR